MQIAIVMFRSRMLTEISRHAADVERSGEERRGRPVSGATPCHISFGNL
jgi:hypothetical protein